MCFVKYFNSGVFVWFAFGNNNPVPASQVRFHQLRVIERFCLEGNNKHSDRVTL